MIKEAWKLLDDMEKGKLLNTQYNPMRVLKYIMMDMPYHSNPMVNSESTITNMFIIMNKCISIY